MALFKKRPPARQPVTDLEGTVLEVGGHRLPLSEALVAARVEGRGLSVIVYHPAMADLLDEPRLQAAQEILLAALGEDGVRRTVVHLAPATHPPIDPFGLDPLRAFVRSLGVPVDPPEA